jgi:hypothetical protein
VRPFSFAISAAVPYFVDRMLASAPASSSMRAQAVSPQKTARTSGVSPSLASAFRLAPCLMRVLTASV